MVDYPVHHGLRHVVVVEDLAPPRELDVGREDQGYPLVAHGDHAEEQPGAVGVGRQVAPFVQDYHVVPRQALQHRGDAALRVGLVQLVHQPRGRREPDPLAHPAREYPQGHGRMGLAVAGASEQHEVLVPVDEAEREHVLPREAVGEAYAVPFEAVEALLEGEVGPALQPRDPARAPQLELVVQDALEEGELALGGALRDVLEGGVGHQRRAALRRDPLELVVARLRLRAHPSHGRASSR